MLFIVTLSLSHAKFHRVTAVAQPTRDDALRRAPAFPLGRERGGRDGAGIPQLALYVPLWEIRHRASSIEKLFPTGCDQRNFTVNYDVLDMTAGIPARRIDPDEVFPRSTRSVLLQCYLFGISWAQVPVAQQPELRQKPLHAVRPSLLRLSRPRRHRDLLKDKPYRSAASGTGNKHSRRDDAIQLRIGRSADERDESGTVNYVRHHCSPVL